MNESMLSFFSGFLSILGNFLASEPVIYFTAIFIGVCVIALVKRLFNLR